MASKYRRTFADVYSLNLVYCGLDVDDISSVEKPPLDAFLKHSFNLTCSIMVVTVLNNEKLFEISRTCFKTCWTDLQISIFWLSEKRVGGTWTCITSVWANNSVCEPCECAHVRMCMSACPCVDYHASVQVVKPAMILGWQTASSYFCIFSFHSAGMSLLDACIVLLPRPTS